MDKLDWRKELAKLKQEEWPGQFEVVPVGIEQVVLAELHKPKPYAGSYHCTYRHPLTGKWVLGQVKEEQVHPAMERQVRGGND